MLPHSNPWDKDYYLTVVCLYPNWTLEPVFVWFDHKTQLPTPMGMDIIQRLVNECDVFAAQNLKYDINVLRYGGINFEGKKLHCTMVTEYLLNGQDKADKSYNLSAICADRGMPVKLDKVSQYWQDGINTYDIPAELLEEYVLDDTKKVHNLTEVQLQEIDPIQKVYDLQMEFIYSLSDMELNGIRWDLDRSTKIIAEYQELLDKYTDRLLEIGGDKRINIRSPQQLAALLYGGKTKVTWSEWVIHEYKTVPECKYYEKKFVEEIELPGLGFIPQKVNKWSDEVKLSTDKGVIQQLKCKTKIQKEVRTILLELSNIKKVISSIQGSSEDKGLINKIQQDGCIHPSFNNAVTVTGRLSSSDPNGQNLPRGGTSPIKQCIIPKIYIYIPKRFFDGVLQADLSQIEWRGAAELSQDQVMIHEINSGIDQHAAAAVDLMELKFINKADPESKENRNSAKVFNFRMIYGGTYMGYYLDPRMPNFSKGKWKQIVENFCNKYYGLIEWQNRNIATVYNNNGLLTIPTGRRFQFAKVQLREGDIGYQERQIKNYPVQGLAGGDILPLWAVIIRRGMLKMKMKSVMVLTVHDSIVFNYIQEELERLARLCLMSVRALPNYISNYFKIDWVTKLDGELEIGPSYGDLHEYSITIN